MSFNKFILLLPVFMVFLAGCVGQYQPSVKPTQPTPTQTAPAGELKEFTVRGSSFKFNPSIINVNKGDTVKITFINEGGGHNLCVEGKGCTKVIQTGQSDTLQFVADSSGALVFFCSVDGHRGLGMEGEITVK